MTAYDRLTYARYRPCYKAQMSQLHTTHPCVQVVTAVSKYYMTGQGRFKRPHPDM